MAAKEKELCYDINLNRQNGCKVWNVGFGTFYFVVKTDLIIHEAIEFLQFIIFIIKIFW